MEDVVDEVEELDIDVLHRAVLREKEEPSEGTEPIPIWMIVAALLLIGWGGWYLGRHDARFDHAVIDGHAIVQATAPVGAPGATAASSGTASSAGPAATEAAPMDLEALGELVYAGRCAACHQGHGKGMPNVAPSLVGSDWVSGDTERLIKVVVHGLSGPIEVNGEPFDGLMPGWGAMMSDEEIAAALTYVRSSWDNEGPEVSPEEVGAVRAGFDRSTPWTAAEL